MAAVSILFADNDLYYLETCQEYLERAGYHVLTATNPSEARGILERGGVALAILDIRLLDNADEEDSSGLMLALEVAPRVPKIIQTGYPTYKAVSRALSIRPDGPPAAVAFLDKSEGFKVMLSTIERALEKSSESPQKGEGELLPVPPVPEDLVESCLANGCVLYAGSGLSAQAHLPTWRPFVSGLLEWACENGFIGEEFAHSLREAIENGDSDSVADSVVSSVGDKTGLLAGYLEETFLVAPPPGGERALPEAHVTLREIPFCAVLTTNFDDLLETAFTGAAQSIYTPSDVEPLRVALNRQRFFLLKLYGTLGRPETLLIAPAQYRAAVSENLLFSRFIESLFFSRTLFFIGASLDGIETYLSGLKFQGTAASRKHYALVNVVGVGWQAKAEVLQRRYNIHVLPYTASPGYPEVVEFLKQFAELVKDAAGKPGGDVISGHAGRNRGAKLTSVRLENIGPFQDQTFHLGKQWSVLLGDNGVGKSFVLKAIAAGICADAASDYAGRLIRGKLPSGTITLEVEDEVNNQTVRRSYVTKLLRKEEGTAEVQSIPIRPLDAENWLALGFPPLRFISWDRRGEKLSGSQALPVPGDLLPLLTGEPDPRLDELKSWLLDLDHKIQRDRSEGAGESRSVRLRDEFTGSSAI